MPQGLLYHVSHLRGTAWLGQPQEGLFFKERKAYGIERIPGEENHAVVHVGRFGLQLLTELTQPSSPTPVQAMWPEGP
jgi:hypothetical protein